MAAKFPEDLSDALASSLVVSSNPKDSGQSKSNVDTEEPFLDSSSTSKTGFQEKLKYRYTESAYSNFRFFSLKLLVLILVKGILP